MPPSEQDLSHLDWARVRWDSLDERFGSVRMEQVLDFIPRQGRHLDVGTGNGDGTLLASEISDCIGLEYGPKSASIAASKGCTVILGDARGMPFENERFGSITCLDVLEHIPRPEKAIDEMVRVLRPGGLLILQTPNAELFKERLLRLVRFFGYRQLQPYDKPLPLGRLRELVRSAGLEIERDEAVRCWDDHFLVRLISWTRQLICRKS